MKKTFLTVLGLVFVPFLFATNSFSQNAVVPEDFSIVFKSESLHAPKNIGIETLTLDASGEATLSPKVWYSGTIPDLTREDLPEETLMLSAEELGQIYSAILENDFFSLDAYYNDPMIMGGDKAELTITANGQTKTVTTRNIKVKAFDRITVTINAALPEKRRLLYNAINGAEYKEVER